MIRIHFVRKGVLRDQEDKELCEAEAPQVPNLNHLVTLNGERYEIVELDWVFQKVPFAGGGNELQHVVALVIPSA
jgi:hypothetical protein